jgi:flagellar biosynthesis/type III secretory pathway chaperone
MEPEAMDRELNALLDILQQEIGQHQALAAELDNEAALDGTLNGGELLRIQGRKNACVRAIRDLEEQRIAIVGRIARGWGEPAASLTLRRIIPRVPEAERARLARCHAELLRLVGRIRELARITSGNAQARLKAIDATLAVIKEALKIHPIYSEEGRLRKRTPILKSTSA